MGRLLALSPDNQYAALGRLLALSPDDQYAALGRLLALSPDVEFDLVDLDACAAELPAHTSRSTIVDPHCR